MRLAVSASALALALGVALPAQAAAVALVLAVDVSESVSSERYMLQHEGIARAFETPQLIDAISAVPGGIEVLVLEWSDPDKIAVTVGWTRIGNRSPWKLAAPHNVYPAAGEDRWITIACFTEAEWNARRCCR